LTGLWQIERGDLRAQQNWDSYYIRHWSNWLDLRILARTVPVLLKGKAYY
jgi:lipopolysaccharide/colanic/teichoic acid biosynthesis glycosyltransferase